MDILILGILVRCSNRSFIIQDLFNTTQLVKYSQVVKLTKLAKLAPLKVVNTLIKETL